MSEWVEMKKIKYPETVLKNVLILFSRIGLKISQPYMQCLYFSILQSFIIIMIIRYCSKKLYLYVITMKKIFSLKKHHYKHRFIGLLSSILSTFNYRPTCSGSPVSLHWINIVTSKDVSNILITAIILADQTNIIVVTAIV